MPEFLFMCWISMNAISSRLRSYLLTKELLMLRENFSAHSV